MTDTLKIKVKVSNTDPDIPLGLEVWVDDQCVTNIEHVTESVTECEVPDTDGNRELRIVMKNKLAEHTVIDADNNIVQDALLAVDLIEFDEINVTDIFIMQSEYTHSFNGPGEAITNRCYGQMGCNGTVSFKFSTPFYLWLLETL